MSVIAPFRYVASLSSSETVRRSANNAAYSVADYLVSPILMILATPFLASRLGLEQYGIWMLANALVGTMGVFNMGLGDATIKYVSSYRAKMDQAGVMRVIRSTLTIYGLLGGIIGAFTFWSAPRLVHYVFKIEPIYHMLAVHAIQLAGIGLVVRSIDSVFVSILRGLERYELTARVTMVVKMATVGSAVGLVAFGYGVVAILLATITLTIIGAMAQAVICRNLVSGFSIWPIIDGVALHEIFSFGIYSSIQGIGGMIFSQVDRLIIVALLGPRQVAYYAICIQLAQQIHSLIAAGFNFIFPLMSSMFESTGAKGLKRIYEKCLILNVLFAILLAFPLIFFGRPILTIWMGADFAKESYVLLAILSVAFCLVSINVVPHNALLGLGKVRFLAITNLLAGLLSIIGVASFIPLMGIHGAAIGRLAYGPVISMNFVKVSRTL